MENIMDKISKKAADTYHVASKRAGKLAKELKLKSQMSENKEKIQELYEDIGKTVYEKYTLKQEINVDRDLLNNCSMIDILADENEDIRMEILKLKDMKQCPECHYEIYYDFHFCPNCGYEQADKKDTPKGSSATIATTDGEDVNLTQHIDSFPNEQQSELESEELIKTKNDEEIIESDNSDDE